MQLDELLKPLLTCRIQGAANPEILAISSDSRRVQAGTLFVAIPGFTVDGHDFVEAAIEQGAVAVMVERWMPNLPTHIPQVVVRDCAYASSVVSDIFYGHPTGQLRTIGVTGTNGKTTVTHVISHVLNQAGHKAGVLGTVGAVIGDRHIPLNNTTPHAVELQGYLRDMVEAECTHAVMEISSHALVERRAAGVRVGIGVFTNLTQDHLDFHGTMERYAAAKSLLFARLGNSFFDTPAQMAYAVINVDDAYAPTMMDACAVPVITYGIAADADIQATSVELSARGASLEVITPVGPVHIQTPLIGRFNVYNVLAAVAVGLIEGIPLSTLAQALTTYQGVPGRCERVDEGQSYGVFVDYAHTPDGLQNVLSSVREFATGRVLVVVGCGGDRDKTKRPLMAQTAVNLADIAIFTSDNPRTEDPEAILDDMVRGVGLNDHFIRIADRRTAIQEAVRLAAVNDIVVIAGKGHEDYQIIGRVKSHFDDREEARLAISERRLRDGR